MDKSRSLLHAKRRIPSIFPHPVSPRAAGIIVYFRLQAVWLPPSVRIGYELPRVLEVRSHISTAGRGATLSRSVQATTEGKIKAPCADWSVC